MARNRRKTYGEENGEADAKACPACGCRHFEVAARDLKTGRVTKRTCRNCGSPVSP